MSSSPTRSVLEPVPVLGSGSPGGGTRYQRYPRYEVPGYRGTGTTGAAGTRTAPGTGTSSQNQQQKKIAPQSRIADSRSESLRKSLQSSNPEVRNQAIAADIDRQLARNAKRRELEVTTSPAAPRAPRRGRPTTHPRCSGYGQLETVCTAPAPPGELCARCRRLQRADRPGDGRR